MDNIYYGMDFALGPARTIIVMVGRMYGKMYFMNIWEIHNNADLISKQLIRRLAADAIITVLVNS